MKKLSELLSFSIDYGNEIVANICDNSKNVTQNCLFAAINGASVNGENFINAAIEKGARYILLHKNKQFLEKKNNVLFIFVPNVTLEFAHICSKFFKNNLENIVAVTGTNGKTSTVDIVRQISLLLKKSTASIGTLGVITKNKSTELPENMTCPNSLVLNKILHELSQENIKNVALEASSHGIFQHRLNYINFSICAFTNFSQDHLDYHENMENYWNAKLKLFSELSQENTVFVLNSDDKYSEKIYTMCSKNKYITYGKNSADLKIINIQTTESYQIVSISFFGEKIVFTLMLQGEFQVYNALCAAAICYSLGEKKEDIFAALEKIHSINGRLELIAQTKGANVYIDYAHTPDALKNAIVSLKKHTKNRLILVFGCGGNRDKNKRAIMGQIAHDFADIIIITDDNPRNEEPHEIRNMILSTCCNATEIPNRKDAIISAIQLLQSGDSLLIAGKGHETYQKIKNNIIYFSDKNIITKILSK